LLLVYTRAQIFLVGASNKLHATWHLLAGIVQRSFKKKLIYTYQNLLPYMREICQDIKRVFLKCNSPQISPHLF